MWIQWSYNVLRAERSVGRSRIKACVEGHYNVREVPYGKDYVWEPAHAVIECDCGRVMDVDARHTACPNCGTDYSGLLREVQGHHLSDEALHPWHPEYEEWLRFGESRNEYYDWLEQRSLG